MRFTGAIDALLRRLNWSVIPVKLSPLTRGIKTLTSHLDHKKIVWGKERGEDLEKVFVVVLFTSGNIAESPQTVGFP